MRFGRCCGCGRRTCRMRGCAGGGADGREHPSRHLQKGVDSHDAVQSVRRRTSQEPSGMRAGRPRRRDGKERRRDRASGENAQSKPRTGGLGDALPVREEGIRGENAVRHRRPAEPHRPRRRRSRRFATHNSRDYRLVRRKRHERHIEPLFVVANRASDLIRQFVPERFLSCALGANRVPWRHPRQDCRNYQRHGSARTYLDRQKLP